jgi:hypothetical protein
MRLTGAFGILLVFAASAWAQEKAAKPTPLIAGTWKLNGEKSGMQVPPDYTEIRQYTMRPDGFLVGLLITGRTHGPYNYLQFAARSDGKEYPEYSDRIVADLVAAGTPTPRTYSETIDDEYTTDWTDKVNGRVTGHGKKIVSKDGKTLTITVDGSSQVRVYDRQ